MNLLTRLPHVGRHGRSTRWRRSRGRMRVWAHRGASALVTENTLAISKDQGMSRFASRVSLTTNLSFWSSKPA